MPMFKRWVGREVTPDGEFVNPATFMRVREEDFRPDPLFTGSVVTVLEGPKEKLYKLIKPIEYSIRTTPW